MENNRVLIAVDYYDLCCRHQIDFSGITKVQVTSKDCGVVLGPGVIDCVAPVLMYKFGGIPLRNASDGLLALWDEKDRDDRDRFYLLCAYLLRAVCPDLWRG